MPSIALAASLAFPSLAVAQSPPIPNPLQYGPGLIGAPAAWAAGYSGAGTAIAIGDTGIDITHPAFTGKIDPRSLNFTLPNPTLPYNPTDIMDTAGHGTSVAGVALASGTSQAPGIAYNANVVVLRVTATQPFGPPAPSYPDTVASSLDYFAGLSKVLIYSNSQGSPLASGTTRPQIGPYVIDAEWAASAQLAVSQGKIIVAAAGNDVFLHPEYPTLGRNPSSIALYPFIQPANAGTGVYDDGGNNFNFSSLLGQSGLIIGATGVGPDKTIAFYANTCGVTASWCVAAPAGGAITDPSGTGGIYTTQLGGGYASVQGTSFAAPAVAGSLALLQQAYPGYGAQDLAHVLFATAENVGGQAADNAIYGYGLVRLDRAIAGPTTLAAGSVVNVANQQMTYWSQPLTTGGAFSKTGSGSLVVAGRTTATGDVNVSSGALGVDGTLMLNTRVIVAPGAALAGFGTIVGNTIVNGTLNAGQLPNYSDLIANNGGTLPAGIPLSGTSPGTLTFNGNVVLGATANTRVNVDGTLQIPGGPGTYDKIVVTGSSNSFTANGTLMPLLRGIPGGNNTYTPPLGQQFPVIAAQGGVLGSYIGLIQPSGLAPSTRFDALYGATSLTLTVTPAAYGNLGLAGLPETANQAAVGSALDAVRPLAGVAMTPAQSSLYAPLYTLPGSAIAPELEQLAPTIYGDALMVRRDAWYLVGGAINEQLDARRGLRSSDTAQAVTDPGGKTIWLSGLGQFGNVSSDGTAGYSSTIGGTAVGVDMAVTQALTVGAAFGFANQTLSAKNAASFSGDSFQFELYGSWRQGIAFLDMQAGGGFAEGTAKRQQSLYGAAVSGNTNGAAGGGSVRGGVRLDAGEWRIEPSLTLAGVTLGQDGLTETQGGPVGMSVGSASVGSLQTLADVRLERRFAISDGIAIVPSAQVGWLHEYLDTQGAATATFIGAPGAPFTVQSAPIGRNAAVVGLRAALETNSPVTLYASYTGTLNGSSNAQTVAAGLRLVW